MEYNLDTHIQVKEIFTGILYDLLRSNTLKCMQANIVCIINLIVAPGIFVESLQFINQRMHI